ncbi:uncharacterized protein LOC141647049 [Silene latifolia]|uniref:uncharacterized protein LOC141647049 n=1 Tax=Silene latifolia TaxID=37657 RepID=UPI003D7865D2
MNPKLHNLPPMKRFRLLHQENNHPNRLETKTVSKPTPISPSRLPTKKRKHSRSPTFIDDTENLPPKTTTPITPPTPTPSPYCLPAKKRIWAFRPDSVLSKIDLNVEYIPSPEKDNVFVLKDEDEEKEDDDGIMCAVCESTDGDPTDPIVFCDGCDLMVHSTCYGNPLIKSIPEGDWFCAKCSDFGSSSSSVNCCLCPVKGGAMKPTKDGRFAHIVCAVLVPEVFFEDSEGRDGIDCSMVPKRRWKEVCYLCKKSQGCGIECSEPKCGLSFHVSCGLKEDLCIELKQGRRCGNGGGIVAAFCRKHTDIWTKQQQTGKYKIVARDGE